ncbi:MAG: hypothetical protein JRJ26_18150 [Deltaproteobacteria bacterium]|nr:hypothetical protein [Deltaproteobacteria bacterium]
MSQERPGLSGKTKKTTRDDFGVEGRDYKAGEVLVKFKPHVADKRRKEIAGSLGLETVRFISRLDVYLMKIRGGLTVREVIERLQRFGEVEYAEPNYVRKASQPKGE